MKRRIGINYDQLFRVLPDNYIVLARDEPNFTIIDASDAMLASCNLERDQVIDRPLFTALPKGIGKDNAKGHEIIKRSIETSLREQKIVDVGIIRYDIISHEDNDHMLRYWQMTIHPVFNDKKLTGFVLVSDDVTDKVLEAEKLKALDVELAETLAVGMIGSWRYNIDKSTVTCDKAVAHMLGLSEAQANKGIEPEEFTNTIDERDRPGVLQALEAALENDTLFEAEYRIVSRHGQQRWVMAKARFQDRSFGRSRHLIGLIIDITDRKKVEADLRESDERFRFMGDMMPHMVWINNAEGRHEYFNKRWFEYTAGNFDSLVGDGWNKFIHPDDVKEVGRVWQHSLKTGENYHVEYRLKNAKTGEYRWFLAKANPYKNAKGTITKWYGSCTDIDDNKKQEVILEEKVAQRTKQLKESNEHLQNFAYVASHDLQEPLRKIQAFSDLLVDEYRDQVGDGSMYLDRIKHSSARMSQLIEDLLIFSRITTKARPATQVDLNETIETVLEDLEHRIERTKGTVKMENKLPTVMADSTHMRQLFQNIVGNALKFHKPDTPAVVTITSTETDDSHVIKVSDNGIGFDKKYTDRIFSMFQRLHGKHEYEGTGIGLAVCRKIVEQYNGILTASSEEGEGATFCVTLPKYNNTERRGNAKSNN